MAYTSYNDNLFIDGIMVMPYNVDDYIRRTEAQLMALQDQKQHFLELQEMAAVETPEGLNTSQPFSAEQPKRDDPEYIRHG